MTFDQVLKNKVDIYKMELNDTIFISDMEDDAVVRRVPGGWIYSELYGENIASVFVPFDNEFQRSISKR